MPQLIASARPEGTAFTPQRNIIDSRIREQYFFRDSSGKSRYNSKFSNIRRNDLRNRKLSTSDDRLHLAMLFSDVIMTYTDKQ